MKQVTCCLDSSRVQFQCRSVRRTTMAARKKRARATRAKAKTRDKIRTQGKNQENPSPSLAHFKAVAHVARNGVTRVVNVDNVFRSKGWRNRCCGERSEAEATDAIKSVQLIEPKEENMDGASSSWCFAPNSEVAEETVSRISVVYTLCQCDILISLRWCWGGGRRKGQPLRERQDSDLHAS